MFSQNIVILLLVASGGGPRSLFTMEVSALEDNSLVEVDDDDIIDSVLHNLTDEDIHSRPHKYNLNNSSIATAF